MLQMKIYLKAAFKIFISFAILILALIIFYKLIFNITYLNFQFLFLFVFFMSIASAHHYIQKKIEITIIDKTSFITYFKEKLNSTPWEIINATKDSMILKPKFNRPYSIIFRERVIMDISEDYVNLAGTKLYVDRLKSIIDGKVSLWDKRFFRYFMNLVLVFIILIPVLFNLGIINRMKINYHEFKSRNIETIKLEENLILGNTEDNINNYGGVAESEGYVFYLKEHLKLYRSDKNFENEVALIDKPSGTGMSYLNVIGDWIFYSSGKTINRIKVDGSNKEKIYDLGYLLDIHVLDNWIYFISHSDFSKLYKMDINGRNLHKLSDIIIKDISIYDNRIYYSYEKDEQSFLESMDLNGQDKQFIANIFPFDLIKVDDTFYYTSNKDFKLYKYQPDKDKEPQKLVDEEISRFIIVDNWIYFSEKGEDVYYPGSSLYRIDLNGENRQKINNDKRIEHLSNVGDWILFLSSKGNQRMNIKDNTIIEMN